MARFTPKIGDLIYIKWEDHCSYDGSGWRHIKSIAKGLTGNMCETVGFVIDMTPEHITTVAHISKDDDGGDYDGSHVATRLRRAIVRGKIIKRFSK